MPRFDRFERLRNRRTPSEPRAIANARLESFSASSSQREFSYMVDSMQPIDADFTNNTFAEAERIKEQLLTNLPSKYSVQFDFQGSVTSDTHIRIHSDIDLLVVHGGFVSLDAGAPNPNPYPGNSLLELLQMRADTAKLLKNKYPAAFVDDKPGKAISLSGGSLKRKVDVIISNWWHTQLWLQYNAKIALGIQLIDSKLPELIRNKPFWHNYEIDKKDKKTGGLRKVIRLLKTLKYDADPELSISSYDITALAWNMEDDALTVRPDAYTALATNAKNQLKRFIDNDSLRSGLMVPNGTRHVFGTGGTTLDQLRSLHRELSELLDRVNSELNLANVRLLNMSSQSKLPTWEEKQPEIVSKYFY